MKILLFFVTLIFCGSSFPFGQSTINYAINLGNKLDSDTSVKVLPGNALSKTITLAAGATSVTAGNYYRLVIMGGGTNGANYQVTNGKTLYCTGAWLYGTALVTFTVGYGTAAVTDNNASAPTGNVVYGNSAATRTFTLATGSAQGTHKFFPFPMSFPSQSFPYIQARDAVEFGAIFLCEEQ